MATTTMPTAPTPKDVQAKNEDRTNLQLALSVGFARDLTRFLGSEEATAAFVAEIYNQARSKPTMHQCTVGSIQLNVAKVAALRLNPSLPNVVQFIPRHAKQKNDKGKEVWVLELTMQYGYAGLRELVMRSPEVVDCFTQAVCVNDYYEPPATAVSPPIHRLPARFAPRGRVEGYYATVKLTNGHWRTLSMSVEDIEAHVGRYIPEDRRGPAWERGKRPDTEVGLTTFDKMALKTVLRMLCNGRDLPMTATVRDAFISDDEATRIPTAAEYQGYDRQGNRPAITAATGVPLDELLQDTYGTRDKAAVEREMAYATRGPQPGEAAAVIEMDPETGEMLSEEPPTTVDSKTGKVTSRGTVPSPGKEQMAFNEAESTRIDREEAQREADRLAREQGLEH